MVAGDVKVGEKFLVKSSGTILTRVGRANFTLPTKGELASLATSCWVPTDQHVFAVDEKFGLYVSHSEDDVEGA